MILVRLLTGPRIAFSVTVYMLSQKEKKKKMVKLVAMLLFNQAIYRCFMNCCGVHFVVGVKKKFFLLVCYQLECFIVAVYIRVMTLCHVIPYLYSLCIW